MYVVGDSMDIKKVGDNKMNIFVIVIVILLITPAAISGSGGDGSNLFDQDLNTTDSVHFNVVNTTSYINTNESYKFDGDRIMYGGTNSVYVGTGDCGGNDVGFSNVGIGHDALKNVGAGGYRYIGIGESSMRGFTGYETTGIGVGVLIDASSIDRSVFVGNYAGQSSDNNDYATAIGYEAGKEMEDGTNNVVLGYKAGYRSKSASVIGIGTNSLSTIDAYCDYSVGIAPYSGYKVAKSQNSLFMGYISGFYAKNTNNSFFIGYYSGYRSDNNENMVGIGSYAGYYAENSEGSSFIGNRAGRDTDRVRETVAIGKEAGESAENSNRSIF